MTDAETRANPYFLQLVISLHAAAMYQMGKTVSPISGKIERDMAQARVSIDMLTMIQEKTAGNLQEDEKRFLDSTIYILQMNFVDELERDKKEAATKSQGGTQESGKTGEDRQPPASEPEKKP